MTARAAGIVALIASAALARTAAADEPAASNSPAAAPVPIVDTWQYGIHGYYRARYTLLEPRSPAIDLGPLSYLEQRLRLEPWAAFGNPADPLARLQVQADLLDDVVWGDNAGLASLPLFAADPSSTGIDGAPRPTLLVKRAWVEFKIPIGRLRIGRMPSQWGLGLLANDGNGFDDDFGDNHDGSTADRILFATRPLQLARGIAGLPATKSGWVFAVAYDALVTSPATFDAAGATVPRYAPAWLASTPDRVQQWVAVLAYDRTPWQPRFATDAFRAGAYFVYRLQPSTESNVFVIDLHARARWARLYVETEILAILGSTRAVPLPPPPPGELPARQDVALAGGAIRGGWWSDRWTATLEMGHASGDSRPDRSPFTGRPLHPDYHVGLVLYPLVIAALTANRWGTSAQGFWSAGGVYNSTYLVPTVKFRPRRGIELIGAWLFAWADELDGAIWNRRPADTTQPSALDLHLFAPDRFLGTEIDAAAKFDWLDLFRWSVEFGVLFPGDLLARSLDPSGQTGGHPIWSLQTRLATVF